MIHDTPSPGEVATAPAAARDAAPARPCAPGPGDASLPLPATAGGAVPTATPAPVSTWITKEAGNRRLPYDRARLERSIDRIHAEFPDLAIEDYKRSVTGFVERKDSVNADDLVDHLIREAEARVDVTAPQWEHFAARLYLHRLYKRASRNRFYDVEHKYGSYVGLQESLADRNIYSNDILRAYSKDELQEAARMVDPERDKLLAYNGLYLLATRYLATDHARNVYELPQERWLTIALYLMQDERPRERRMQLVGEAYWALSNLYMTVATPTLQNAGKVGGQLSSCFIDTVEDSLQGIFDSNTDIARVSKGGGAWAPTSATCAPRGRRSAGFPTPPAASCRGSSSSTTPPCRWTSSGSARAPWRCTWTSGTATSRPSSTCA